VQLAAGGSNAHYLHSWLAFHLQQSIQLMSNNQSDWSRLMIVFFAKYGERLLREAKIYTPGQEGDKEQSKKSNGNKFGLL
jgi:hypothetical protein